MSVPSALIGFTGLVGSNLLTQRAFKSVFNSKTIDQIEHRAFNEIVCAGVQSVKWWANQNPVEDLRRIDGLISHLDHVTCDRFVLISTVDVFVDCAGATEDTPVVLDGLHSYGRNRAYLEGYAAQRFPRSLIVRLPALFGPGLKKNALFDLMHDNRISAINPESSFQWYPLSRLAADLDRAAALDLSLLHLSVEPIRMAALAERFFPGKHLGGDGAVPSRYDIRSKHAARFGGEDGYVVTADEAAGEIGRFLDLPAAA